MLAEKGPAVAAGPGEAGENKPCKSASAGIVRVVG